MSDHSRPSPVSVRELRVEDAAAMVLVLSDPDLYRFTGGAPPTPAELQRRYAVQTVGHSADHTQEWVNWLVTLGPGEEPIGYVQATIPADGGPTEIAWVIGAPWQGRGYAHRAADLLVDGLARRGVRRVLAHIHPAHEASRRIATRLGLAPTRRIVDGEVRWEGVIGEPTQE